MEDAYLPKEIARQMVTDIISGKLSQKEKIVEERYADRYGVSRTPVREALYLLEIEGMVERIPNRGAFVKEYNRLDLVDLFEVRVSVEILSVDRIKFPINNEKVHEIDEIIKEMQNADIEKYAKLNNEFHYKVLSLSYNEVLKNLYQRLGTPLIALQKFALNNDEYVKESLDDHIMLWQALKNKKINLSKSVLLDHVKSGKDRFLRKSGW